ncbi:hypothetical protein LCGC14_1408030 [marine sediment metagenome]|uniref:Uncharacterized protein n=1 Tax=marine sediment metagenome TaxID=412755 RepID=A0A0F9JV28_9ZZZZ
MKGGKEQLPREVKAYSEMGLELTKVNMANLKTAIFIFTAEQGRTPKDLKELRAVSRQFGATLDSWGTAIKYEKLSDENFRLISAGKDRVFNTSDDIAVEY